MTDPLLRSAVEAIVLRPPLSFSWCDVDQGAIPWRLRRTLSEDHLYLDLEHRIVLTLYESFYARGAAVPADATIRPRRGDPSFVRALSRANSGSGYLDLGWTLVGRDGASGVFTKGGLTFTVPDGVWTRGSTTLRLPKERFGLAPGFYMALADHPLDRRERLTRIYWNVDSSGAAPLVDSVTRLLNRRGLPFRLKVVDHPDCFARCDAAVLYVRRSDRSRAWPLIEISRRRVTRHLRERVPAFTKRIAAGIAVADEPPGGESFGMDRCGIVAHALITAARNGQTDTDARLTAIATAFRGRGLDPDRPFLNPGTRDVYPRLTS